MAVFFCSLQYPSLNCCGWLKICIGNKTQVTRQGLIRWPIWRTTPHESNFLLRSLRHGGSLPGRWRCWRKPDGRCQSRRRFRSGTETPGCILTVWPFLNDLKQWFSTFGNWPLQNRTKHNLATHVMLSYYSKVPLTVRRITRHPRKPPIFWFGFQVTRWPDNRPKWTVIEAHRHIDSISPQIGRLSIRFC